MRHFQGQVGAWIGIGICFFLLVGTIAARTATEGSLAASAGEQMTTDLYQQAAKIFLPAAFYEQEDESAVSWLLGQMQHVLPVYAYMGERRQTAGTLESSLGYYEVLAKEASVNLNLSDFALFLSVMKNKKAFQNVLEIILDEPIDLEEVKVEEVILNSRGQRAIRLDAWARSSDKRQFAVEMQNDTEKDDVRKRSRFYQGLMDVPILKSGKQTQYRWLPATVVIFITMDDIFGMDRAMYTFTECCRELPELELGDGVTKIFCNMTSKNGREELVSMLQYMKRTDLKNPDITDRSERLIELDEVVQEVKSSEEWEEVEMSLLQTGLSRGEEIGKEIGEKIGKEIGEKIGKEIGEKVGKEIGEKIGRKAAIAQASLNMYARGMKISDAAAILSEDEAVIEDIYKMAEKRPECTVEDVMEEVFGVPRMSTPHPEEPHDQEQGRPD